VLIGAELGPVIADQGSLHRERPVQASKSGCVRRSLRAAKQGNLVIEMTDFD